MARDMMFDEDEVRSARLCIERAIKAFEETRRALERSQEVLQQSMNALGPRPTDAIMTALPKERQKRPPGVR